MNQVEPVAVIRCGAPAALRRAENPDTSLIPENQDGLPCDGGFNPSLACARCAFAQEATGEHEPEYGFLDLHTRFDSA